MKICVIGAGTMGSGITQAIAGGGFEVILRDVEEGYLERGLSIIAKNLNKEVSKGRMTEGDRDEALSRITTTLDIEMAAECEIVIEAAFESMEVKKGIFAQLDKVCKRETILASNTSSLSITEIASATQRPERVIGMHFFNPVPVMKLVEVIKGIGTSEHTRDTIVQLAKDLGKDPVEVDEAPGFVVNRVLVPMINEAVGILADGVATAEDIDKAMKLGANHPIGPLALADLIGNDVCLAIMEVLYEEYKDTKYRPHPLLRKMVRGGMLGRKTGRGFFGY